MYSLWKNGFNFAKWSQEKDLEPAWMVSVSANAVLLGKNQSEVGARDAQRDAAAVLPITEGSWTHYPPPEEKPSVSFEL